MCLFILTIYTFLNSHPKANRSWRFCGVSEQSAYPSIADCQLPCITPNLGPLIIRAG